MSVRQIVETIHRSGSELSPIGTFCSTEYSDVLHVLALCGFAQDVRCTTFVPHFAQRHLGKGGKPPVASPQIPEPRAQGLPARSSGIYGVPPGRASGASGRPGLTGNRGSVLTTPDARWLIHGDDFCPS